MANKEFSDVRIQTKRDTSANWTLNNPVLLYSEKIIVETNNGELREKIGDGVKRYSELPFTDEPIRTLISTKVDKVTGKGLSTNDYTTTEKEKLANIEDNANNYVHPTYSDQSSGLYKITVEDGHVKSATAVTKTDITNLGIPAQDTNTTYDPVTSTEDGLMTSEDKSKLDGIEDNANKYIHPTNYTTKALGLYKVEVENTGHVKSTSAITKADITGLGIPAQDTTYTEATSTTAGLMSKDDKAKLDGLSNYNHPSTHPATMITEDTTHRFVTDAEKSTWNAKASTAVATSSANGLMSSGDKSKLDGIEANANKYVHPEYDDKASGLYKITVEDGHVSATTAVTKADITALGIPAQDTNTTYDIATTDSDGLMSSEDKSKLDGIEDNANKYIHPTSHAATMITEDTTHRFVTDAEKATWNAKASTSVATSSANGLMSKTDKAKLDGIEDNANNYTHPSYDDKASGLYKITVEDGHVSATTAVTKSDITGLGIPAQDTTYSVATTTANGLMSKDDKSKLDGIEANANKYTHPVYSDQASGLYKITVEDGHVSAVSAVTKTDITGLGIPGSNTTYKAGTGLELSTDNTFNHSNSITAGTAKGSDTKTLAYAGTFTIPSITYDSEGHITNTGTTTMTMPAAYSHPSTHPATMITQDTTHRFVTDDQITEWDAKAKASDLTSHTGNKSNPHSVTKSQVGLGNVTNDAQVKRSEMGVAGGVATLDENGTVPSSQLPSYVDDVIEGYYYNSKFHEDSAHSKVITGESSKIYVNLETGENQYKTYRWSGSAYVVISETLALGETSSTAYAGDKGKANADAIALINEKLVGIEDGANNYTHPTHTAYSSGLYKVTVDGKGHVTAATKVAKTDITGLGIPAQDTTYSVATTAANGLMSKDDKAKLDGLSNYTHPTHTAYGSGLYKVTVNSLGHVTAATAVTKADITGLGIPGQDTDNNTTYDLSAPASLENGNVKLNLTAGGSGSGTDSVAIKGSGATTVTTNSSGEIIISSTDNNTTYSVATTAADGLMSKTDKAKLDGLSNYTHPSYTARSAGLYKVTVDGTGHVSAVTAVAKADITGLGIPGSDTNTTYDLSAPASATDGNVKLNLTAGGSGSGTDSVAIKGSGATTVTTNSSGEIIISSTDNNTHYTSKNIVGASSTATANAAAGNGSVYLNHLEESSVKSSHNIKGTGAATVTSDANGVITINVPNLEARLAAVETKLLNAVFYG